MRCNIIIPECVRKEKSKLRRNLYQPFTFEELDDRTSPLQHAPLKSSRLLVKSKSGAIDALAG